MFGKPVRVVKGIWHSLSKSPPGNRHAQLLVAFLFLLLSADVPALIYTLSADPQLSPWRDQSLVAALLGLVGFGAGYLINRIGRYRAAAWTTVITLNIIIYINAWPTEDGSSVYYLVYLMLVAIISSVFLENIGMLLVTIINIVILLCFPIVAPNVSHQQIPLNFFMITTVIILVASRHRNLIERDRRAYLMESEARYRQLVELSPDTIYIQQDYIIRFINSAGARQLGADDPEAVTGQRLSAFIHPDTQAEAEAQTQRIETNAHPSFSETRLVRHDGAEMNLEVAHVPFHYQGKKAAQVIMRDITARKRAEQHTIDLAVEREKVNALAYFIGDASHDLKTPLTTIKVSLAVLRRSNDEQLRTKHLDILEMQTNHLHKLLEDMLAMYRLDRKTSFASAPIDLNQVAAGAVQHYKPFAERKRHHLRYFPAAQAKNIIGDPEELKRAVGILLQNAINYTPEGGTVTVRLYEHDGYMAIEVEDTGIGIEAADLPHIFRRFYRAGTARPTDQGGMGLGLTIAQKIIQAHDGQITVESTPGVGSVFRILLPHPKHLG